MQHLEWVEAVEWTPREALAPGPRLVDPQESAAGDAGASSAPAARASERRSSGRGVGSGEECMAGAFGTGITVCAVTCAEGAGGEITNPGGTLVRGCDSGAAVRGCADPRVPVVTAGGATTGPASGRSMAHAMPGHRRCVSTRARRASLAT